MSNFDRNKAASAGKKWGVYGALGLAFAIVAGSSAFVTDSNERHVVTTFGEISHVTEPGINFKIPFVQGATAYPVDVQQFRMGPKNIASRGNQSLEAVVVDFQYTIPTSQIPWLHANARDYHDRIQMLGTKAANEVLGTTESTALAASRQRISQEIANRLREELAANDMNLNVTAASLTNFEWDPVFRDSIRVNNEIKNEIERRRAEQERERIQAQNVVIIAEGAANSKRAEAEGEADRNRALAEGQRDAQIAQTDGISYQLRTEGEARAEAFRAEIEAFGDSQVYVDFIKARQWDGRLPTIVGGGGEGMFIDLRSPEAVGASRAPAPTMR